MAEVQYYYGSRGHDPLDALRINLPERSHNVISTISPLAGAGGGPQEANGVQFAREVVRMSFGLYPPWGGRGEKSQNFFPIKQFHNSTIEATPKSHTRKIANDFVLREI
jgi:hypothetical protein